MRFTASAIAAAVAVAVAGPAAADFSALTGDGPGNSFGDDRLSYKNGVVYDDDLVPGRGPDQPFLVDEQAGGGAAGYVPASPPPIARQRPKPPPRR